VEFRLLGPVQLCTDDRVLDVGPPQRRAVLAALALDAGTPVPLETLVDRVWDDAPPEGARAAIYAHVARLRRMLDPPVALRRLPGGYVLDADRDRVDLYRFRRLAADGRDPDLGDAERAAALRKALRLWRGTPLADVSGQWAAGVRYHVEQQLLAVALTWAQTDLRLGVPEPVIERFSDLVTAYPFAENVVATLMRALCAAGRSAEALAQFEAASARLREHLGTEPGEQLTALYEAIRRRELDPPAVTVRQRGFPPRQLPADVAGFTGRVDELALLHETLVTRDRTGPVVISAIDGAGGVGKSGLAIHAAHRVADAFPDGQLYVDLRGATEGLPPLEPVEVLGRFLRALGVAGTDIPSQEDEAAAWFRTQAAGRRLLVVLDNAVDEAQVRPLLPGTAGCGVLVTSRRTLAGLGTASHLRLDVLTPAEAGDLLGVLVGPDRVAAEPAAAGDVAQRCGYLPLALRIAGARLAARPRWPLAALADRLARERHRLDELEISDLGVRASFAVSHRQLRPAEATAFATLGTWDGPDIGLPLAAHLLDVPDEVAERVLDRLVDASLLETSRPGRYRLHDLLRLYARERAEVALSEPGRMAALDRALHWYVATVWHTLALQRPGDPRLDRIEPEWLTGGLRFANTTEALSWLDAERGNLLAAATQAAGTSVAGAVPRLVPGMFVFFLQRGYWHECVRLNRTALGVAVRSGDRLAEAQVLSDLAGAYEFQGNPDDALDCLQRSLDIHQELDNPAGRAAILNNLGIFHSRQGRYAEALDYVQQSLAINLGLDNRNRQALNLDTLAALYARQRRYEEALDCYERSLPIHRELGGRWDEAKILNRAAEIYTRLHRYDDATACVEQSLAICDELDSRAGRASNLDVLGTIHQARHRYAEALDCHRRSVDIFRDLGQRQDEAEALHHASAALEALGRTDEAAAQRREALAIYDQLHAPAPT